MLLVLAFPVGLLPATNIVSLAGHSPPAREGGRTGGVQAASGGRASPGGAVAPIGTPGELLAASSHPPLLFAPSSFRSTTVPVGSLPEIATYDPGNGYVYVPNTWSNNISVLNGSALAGTVNVGSFPYSATYDPADGFIYVQNEWSGNVSVINGTRLIGTVRVGSSNNTANNEEIAAYDPSNQLVYVPNSDDNNVSLLRGTSVVGSVAVGGLPTFVTYDPTNGFVYVTNDGTIWGSTPGNLTVLNGTAVVGSVAVGDTPGLPVVGPNGDLYVPDYGSGQITVVQDTTILATLNGTGPYWFATSDPQNGYVYVTDGAENPYDYNVTVVNGTKVVGTAIAGSVPQWAAYDPQDNLVFVPNYNGGTLTVLQGTSVVGSVDVGWGPFSVLFDPGNACLYVPNSFTRDVTVLCPTIQTQVIFTERGLANETTWAATLDGATRSGPGNLLFPSIPNGSYPFTIGEEPGYVATPVDGNLTVQGANVTETVTFAAAPPDQGSYTFTETGLPGRSNWTVDVNGTSIPSVSNTINFTEVYGSYPYSVGAVVGYAPEPASGDLTVSASIGGIAIAFRPAPDYAVTLTETGLPQGTPWSATISGERSTSSGPALTFNESNGSYEYAIGTVNGWTTSAFHGALTVQGAPMPVALDWMPVLYPVAVLESGLPPLTPWWINVTDAGSGALIASPTETFVVANGSYAYSVSTSDQDYFAVGGEFHVNGTPAALVAAFSPRVWVVTFVEAGLPAGASWSVTLASTVLAGVGGLTGSGEMNGTYLFSIGPEAGYIASPAGGQIMVRGAPVTQTVTFHPSSPGPVSGTRPTGYLGGSAADWLVPGALVAAGVVILAVAWRRRSRTRTDSPLVDPRP